MSDERADCVKVVTKCEISAFHINQVIESDLRYATQNHLIDGVLNVSAHPAVIGQSSGSLPCSLNLMPSSESLLVIAWRLSCVGPTTACSH